MANTGLSGDDLLHSATPTDWHPDFAAQRAGENGEISAHDAMEILGVEVGDDPNCINSDNDFVVSGEHPHFEHLRTERDGFAKVFICCEFVSSRAGTWQFPQYRLQLISSPSAHLGLVLALERDSDAEVAEVAMNLGSEPDKSSEETSLPCSPIHSPTNQPGDLNSVRVPRSSRARRPARVVVRRVEKGCAPDWCGMPVVGDEIVSIDGETVEEMGRRVHEAREARKVGTRGGMPVGWGQRSTAASQGSSQAGRRFEVQGMLAARARMTGTQGTFCWMGVFRPPEVLAEHPVVISDKYLPAFAPHLRVKPQRDDPRVSGLWFEVRLLRGTPQYVEQVHQVDWEAYIRSKEVHEEERRMEQGMVPLLLKAGEEGDEEALQRLVGSRADPDWGNAVGTTALHMAALHGHAGTAALLVTLKANVNAVDIFEATPIQKAARRGHQEVVDTLVLVKADITHVDMWEANAMHWAAANLQGGRAQAHLELLEGFGANAKQKNLDGLHPARVLQAGVARGYLWGRKGHGEDLVEVGAGDGTEGGGGEEDGGSEGAGEGEGALPGEEGGRGPERRVRSAEEEAAVRPVRHLLAAVGLTAASAALDEA